MTDLTRIFGAGGFDAAKFSAPAAGLPQPSRESKAGYAQLYAVRGWCVLPLHWIKAGACSCRKPHCHSPGKHPLNERGVNEATTDRGIVAEWWRTWPEANIGIATGPRSGFFVLDVDPRNGGDSSLERLADELGGLPDSVLQLTGGGGQHYLFEYPADGEIRGGNDKLGKGLDIKAAGGYIVVEPSDHISGTHYAWEASSDPLEGVAIMPAGARLLERLRERPASNVTTNDGAILPPERVAEIRSALAVIPADNRDDYWLAVGMALHSTGAGLQAFGLWSEWSQLSEKYDAADQARVWNSFRDRGDGRTMASLFAMARAHGWTEAGASWLHSAQQLPPREDVEAGFQFLSYAELCAAPTPPEWLVTDLLERDTLTVLYGDSDAYKSFAAIDIGLNVAAGRPWHGRRTHRGPVFYICGEGHRGIARRITAWRLHNQVTSDLPFFASKVSAELTSFQSAQAVSDACQKIATALKTEPVLVIVDTLAANFGAGDENSTKDMNLFLTLVRRLLRERFGAAVLVVHHVGNNDKTRERGSYALRGNADGRIRVERTDTLRTTLYAEKTKDAEQWAPISLSLAVIPLGIEDGQGRPVTSLAITQATIEDPNKSTFPAMRRGAGGNQKLMLRLLLSMYKTHRQNLTDNGHSPSGARILMAEWKRAAREAGLHRNQINQAVEPLSDARLIVRDGLYVDLSPAGIAVAEASDEGDRNE